VSIVGAIETEAKGGCSTLWRKLILRRRRAGFSQERRGADLSQEELAQLIGVHRLNVGRLERGARLPRLDSILKVAGLEVSPCELLAGLRWTPGFEGEGRFVAAGGTTAAEERAGTTP
jgi:transcriptional regulator with XRE-family HTH domain